MRAYEIQTASVSLDGLKLVERAKPTPAPGQILVRMRAASINYRDYMVITGAYFGGSVKQPLIPFSDGAGEVVALGADVTRFKVGDRVASTFFRGFIDGPPRGPHVALGSPVDGVLAEYVTFDQQDAVRIPDTLSFEEASTLPCAAVTAWHALVVVCGVKPGDTVLVLGSGGVSMFALQFAKLAGARVFMTSSSDAKLERGRALGAAECINYRSTPEWDQEVLRRTDGRGVDYVVEVGGAGTLARSMRSVAYSGKVALIGVLTGFQGDTNPHSLMLKGASTHGIFVGNRAMFESMNRAIAANDLHPVIDQVFDFDHAPAALRYVHSGEHFGKVVVRI